jgi:excisionase family DNA binding protein
VEYQKPCNSNLLTYQDVAKYLRVAPITVRKWVSAGVISSVKIGSSVRFTPEMIEEFVRNSTRAGGAR